MLRHRYNQRRFDSVALIGQTHGAHGTHGGHRTGRA
jgi:hypothetical protein